MRLHLNENTAGCSPAVADALARLGRRDAGLYPDYGEAQRAVAEALAVPVSRVLLTNGMDEGILAATAAAFRDRTGGVPEGLGVRPAFDMYETLVTAFGGRMVTVAMDEAFRLPADALRRAVTADTRIVFVTNPHNPSGANFVLVQVGPAASAVVAALAARGIRVRDRSREPGCEGCIRITAGIVDETTRVIPALEEAICAAR
jgi:histidinol-phosphate aminotransferase